MAYIVATKPGRFEARESRATADGPRSRTLASFRELDEAALEKIRDRASKPPDVEDLRRKARRAGAPVAVSAADRAARDLIAELGRGARLDPRLRELLLEFLDEDDGLTPEAPRDARASIAGWMAATPSERGRALVDLLLLGDALPHGGRVGKPLEFPRLDSTVFA